MTTMRTFQASFSSGEIAPALRARSDLSRFATSLAACRNFIIHKAGGASNRPGTKFLGEVENSDFCPTLIPFRFDNMTQVCILEMGEKTMRVWFRGELVVDGSAPFLIKTPYSAEEAKDLNYVQSANVVYFAHKNHPPQKLSRTSWTDWNFKTVDFIPTVAPPPKGKAVLSGSVGAKATMTASYKVSALSDDTGEESLAGETFSLAGAPTPEDWPASCRVKLTWDAAEGFTYNVFKEINGVYGNIGIAAKGSFDDTNIVPDLANTAPEAVNPFKEPGDYPGVATIHQQRAIYAATTNKPNGIWATRVGFYENMSKSSPARDDDAIAVTMGSGEVNEIRGLISVQDLIVLTSGSENVVNGGNTRSAITPSSISIFPQSYWGASKLRPIVSGNTVLFTQALGGVVRDLAYEYSVDGFSGNDKSIMSSHLLEGRAITSWCYCQTPESTIWLGLDDGSLLSMTYFKEQDIGGWAKHTTDGFYERVLSLEGDGRDDLYVVVRRLINGTWKRYIERMAPRSIRSNKDAYFLDSFLVYDGENASRIEGLDHLEGKSVGIFANGDVVLERVVQNGAISLPRAYDHVVVGLAYDKYSWIETLDVNGSFEGAGALGGRMVAIPKITVKTEMSREFLAGPSRDRLTLTKIHIDRWGDPISPATGDVNLAIDSGWRRGGGVVIAPGGPVPLTVLAVLPSTQLGLAE